MSAQPIMRIRVSPGESFSICNNMFRGSANVAATGKGPTEIRNLFVMPLAEAGPVIALTSTPRGLWRRAWLAIARFALRRLS